MNVAEYKLKIFQDLMPLNDKPALKQIHEYISSFLTELKPVAKERKSRKLVKPESFAEEIGFEEWNKQFEDDRSLDEYIPEYEMTLGEFRREIYEAEMGEIISVDEFQQKLRKLYA